MSRPPRSLIPGDWCRFSSTPSAGSRRHRPRRLGEATGHASGHGRHLPATLAQGDLGRVSQTIGSSARAAASTVRCPPGRPGVGDVTEAVGTENKVLRKRLHSGVIYLLDGSYIEYALYERCPPGAGRCAEAPSFALHSPSPERCIDPGDESTVTLGPASGGQCACIIRMGAVSSPFLGMQPLE